MTISKIAGNECLYILYLYITKIFINEYIISKSQHIYTHAHRRTLAQLAGAVEYSDCFSAEG